RRNAQYGLIRQAQHESDTSIPLHLAASCFQSATAKETPMRRFVLLPAFIVVGCSAGSGETGGTAGPESGPRYYEDVAPILQKNCLGCHSKGNIAPLPLETYDEAHDKANLIATATTSKKMPPFHVDDSGTCNDSRDARVLDDADIATLAAWAKAAAPMGDPADAPAPPPKAPGLEPV